MPYLLNGTTIRPNKPFTSKGINYPSNWIASSTESERVAVGLTWQPDPVQAVFDQRFAWGVLPDNTTNWKSHLDLVTIWTETARSTAGTLLAPTDWMVIREADNGTAMPTDWKMWRQAVRQAADEKVLYVMTSNDSADLAAYVTSSAFSQWPASPDQAAPADDASAPVDPVIDLGDTITFASGSTTAGIG